MINIKSEDTICAIATPTGKGALAIVRMSGKDSFKIISKILKTRKDFSDYVSHKAIYGNIVYNNKVIDEVVCIKYKSPNSFTGEDLVEINCHGGFYLTNKILEILIENKARLAEPGEFSKRAFINSKMDLSQAEAIQELISSESEKSRELAIKNLKGQLSDKIRAIKDTLVGLTANIDVLIDYPEYDYEELKPDNIIEILSKAKKEILKLIDTYKRGVLVKEGIKIVIAGNPNVGKSTFLNKFIGKNRAIVTNIPGTTRDTIEEKIEIKGFPVILIDTAGVRKTDNEIEKLGVERTKKAIEDAEIILLIIDAKEGITKEAVDMLKEQKHKDVLIVVNKIDQVKEEYLYKLVSKIDHSHVLTASFIKNEGINKIENKILELLNLKEFDKDDVIISNLRHKRILMNAKNSIELANSALLDDVPLDLIEIDLKEALYALGEITGENVDNDIINTIFSNFCLGK